MPIMQKKKYVYFVFMSIDINKNRIKLAEARAKMVSRIYKCISIQEIHITIQLNILIDLRAMISFLTAAITSRRISACVYKKHKGNYYCKRRHQNKGKERKDESSRSLRSQILKIDVHFRQESPLSVCAAIDIHVHQM